jgi:hypothetical protein
VSLVVDEAGTSAFIKADVVEQCVLLKFKELCSFGSGTWFDGPNALDVMENAGPWLNCQLNLQSLVLLEKKGLVHILQICLSLTKWSACEMYCWPWKMLGRQDLLTELPYY